MILIAATLLLAVVWIGLKSLWLQQTTVHHQWISHNKAIINGLCILAGFVLQEILWKQSQKE